MLFNLFPDRWRYFRQLFDASVTERMGQYQMALELPDKEVLAKMLVLKLAAVDLDSKALFDPDELDSILSHRSIRSVLNCAADYYRYKVEGIPLPTNTLSFEARVDRTLQELRQEIAELRQHLHLEKKVDTVSLNPVPREVVSYIEQKQGQLAAVYNRKNIISDTDDLGKLRLILDALQPLYGFQLDYLRLGSDGCLNIWLFRENSRARSMLPLKKQLWPFSIQMPIPLLRGSRISTSWLFSIRISILPVSRYSGAGDNKQGEQGGDRKT